MTFLAANPFADPLTKWMVICAVVLTLLYAVFRSGFRRKDPLRDQPGGHLSQQRAVEREMSNVLVELSEMARQITAQLDTRAARLESLIQDADRKIAQLQRQSTSPSGSALPPPAIAPTPVMDERYQAIYDLADQGLDARQIAGKLDRPRGEIELILALREKIAVSAASGDL